MCIFFNLLSTWKIINRLQSIFGVLGNLMNHNIINGKLVCGTAGYQMPIDQSQ